MKIEQQREYVYTLMGMWTETAKVCGMLSKPERAMLVELHKEWMKLLEMEADSESSARVCGFPFNTSPLPDELRKEWVKLLEMEEGDRDEQTTRHEGEAK